MENGDGAAASHPMKRDSVYGFWKCVMPCNCSEKINNLIKSQHHNIQKHNTQTVYMIKGQYFNCNCQVGDPTAKWTVWNRLDLRDRERFGFWLHVDVCAKGPYGHRKMTKCMPCGLYSHWPIGSCNTENMASVYKTFQEVQYGSCVDTHENKNVAGIDRRLGLYFSQPCEAHIKGQRIRLNICVKLTFL